MSEEGLSTIIKEGLMENSTLLNFDARLNPGFTETIHRQMALVTLKNIERARSQGFSINKEWIVPQIYQFKTPLLVLKQLNLKMPGAGKSQK